MPKTITAMTISLYNITTSSEITTVGEGTAHTCLWLKEEEEEIEGEEKEEEEEYLVVLSCHNSNYYTKIYIWFVLHVLNCLQSFLKLH